MTSKVLLSIFMILFIVSGCASKSGQTNENTAGNENKSKTFIPDKEDVIQDSFYLTNVDKLERFIADMNSKVQGKIRVVRYLEGDKFADPDAPIIFDLQYVYDKQAKQGWIQVQPDRSYLSSKQAEKELMNNPQQCSTITKDEERGYYMLTECHDAWEYKLFPLEGDVVGKTRGSGW
ncbi:DUF4362 domain-containing protein [Bacillus sp. NEB1478]|uniref:DUF4362 domain-containing protein n=1 Tax=Bacillus sp. NEB1478 TaxID=3073816 RepID=UPI002872AFC6|nr:DUF4362 domain-containing protein [Bacillus sp. NEB1478]WNB91106.1 DUF4362 domain-containing protein [Bacillus sp. NEB1478]